MTPIGAAAGGCQTVRHAGAGIATLDWARVATDDAALARCLPLTSPGERQQARRHRFERDRRRFLARRAAVRRMLAARLDRDPASLDIGRTALGKPFLRDAEIGFSTSYADDLVLLVIANAGAVGCDLAARGTGVAAWPAADALFCAREVAAMRDAGKNDFVRAWTLKEACGKALGRGLAGVLNDFDTTDICAKATTIPYQGSEWIARSWELIPGYQAAVFVARTPATMKECNVNRARRQQREAGNGC